VAISANAVQAAPVGLAATISTVAAFAATTIATATSATKALAMTTIQKTLIATSLVAAVGTGIYEANQAATLRAEIRRLQQQASLTVQTGELTREGDEQDLTALREHNEWRNTAELLRLRAQVERLRRDSQELARLSTGEKSNDPMELAARTLVGRINALKQGFEERPNLSIPELAYLNPNRWASVAHDYKLETDDEFREALCSLRNHAKESFAPELGKALINYIVANDGQLPSDALQLKVYFQSPVDDALLQRYEMLHTGRMSDFPIKELLIAEKAPVDEQYESLYKIGASGILMRESGFAARAAMRRGQRRRLTGLDPSRNRIDRRFPPLIA